MTLTMTCQVTADDFAAESDLPMLRLFTETAAAMLDAPRRFPRLARHEANSSRPAVDAVAADALELEPERWDGLS